MATWSGNLGRIFSLTGRSWLSTEGRVKSYHILSTARDGIGMTRPLAIILEWGGPPRRIGKQGYRTWIGTGRVEKVRIQDSFSSGV